MGHGWTHLQPGGGSHQVAARVPLYAVDLAHVHVDEGGEARRELAARRDDWLVVQRPSIAHGARALCRRRLRLRARRVAVAIRVTSAALLADCSPTLSANPQLAEFFLLTPACAHEAAQRVHAQGCVVIHLNLEESLAPFAGLVFSWAVKAEANRGKFLARERRLVFGGRAAQVECVAALERRAAELPSQRVRRCRRDKDKYNTHNMYNRCHVAPAGSLWGSGEENPSTREMSCDSSVVLASSARPRTEGSALRARRRLCRDA